MMRTAALSGVAKAVASAIVSMAAGSVVSTPAAQRGRARAEQQATASNATRVTHVFHVDCFQQTH
ncbi:MAG: hypothetical protein R2912_09220 [Eubacteriales bacterium]